MDSDEERNLSHAQNKQYAVLRSDLAAALAAFDRAQDWAVRLGTSLCFALPRATHIPPNAFGVADTVL